MLNWANLVEKGRAKAFGIPWSEEEAHAVYDLQIPAEYVRQGCLTVKAYEKALAVDDETEKQTGEKKLEKMTLPELQAKATSLEIAFTPDATKKVLVELIKEAQTPKQPEDNEPKGDGSEGGEDDAQNDVQ